MQRKKKLKPKLKKILVLFVAVIVAFSCFIVNVSAAGATGTVYNIPMNQPTADEFSGYIECRYRNTSTGVIIPVVYFWRVYPAYIDSFPELPTTAQYPRVAVDVSDTSGVSLQVNMPNPFEGSSDILHSFSVSYGRILGHSGYVYYGHMSNENGSSNIEFDFYLDPGFEIYGFKLYGNALLDSVYTGYQPESLFTFLYSENSVLYENILSMATILGSSTDKITQNQDNNANKIINGGTDSPHYTNPNEDETINDYDSKEHEALDNTQEGFNQYSDLSATVKDIFNNEGIGSGGFIKGIQAASSVFSPLFSMDFVRNLLAVSLYVGMFAFLVNSLPNIISKIKSSNSNKGGKNKYP